MSLHVVGGGGDGGRGGPAPDSAFAEAERLIAGIRLRLEGIANRLAELSARLGAKDAPGASSAGAGPETGH